MRGDRAYPHSTPWKPNTSRREAVHQQEPFAGWNGMRSRGIRQLRISAKGDATTKRLRRSLEGIRTEQRASPRTQQEEEQQKEQQQGYNRQRIHDILMR